MALDCTTCGHKQNAMSQGHCTEFDHIPELDACAMHTLGASASKEVAAPVVIPGNTPAGGYLWLKEIHPASQIPQVS